MPSNQANLLKKSPKYDEAGSMSGSEQADLPPTEEAAQLEDQMSSELTTLRNETSGPVRSHLNPVFQHEQRAGTAADAAQATETAARVNGEIGSEADQERLKIEGLVQSVEKAAPGSDKAKDAEAAAAQAEKEADDAVTASLDSDAAAEDALKSEGSRHLHLSASPDEAKADEARALKDESLAAKDLSDLDSLEQRVADDAT
jgi:hypothetical protein